MNLSNLVQPIYRVNRKFGTGFINTEFSYLVCLMSSSPRTRTFPYKLNRVECLVTQACCRAHPPLFTRTRVRDRLWRSFRSYNRLLKVVAKCPHVQMVNSTIFLDSAGQRTLSSSTRWQEIDFLRSPGGGGHDWNLESKTIRYKYIHTALQVIRYNLLDHDCVRRRATPNGSFEAGGRGKRSLTLK